MSACAYIAYVIIVLLSSYIYTQQRNQKRYVTFTNLYRRTVYSSSNSSFQYPMTELLDYVWLLEENNRGLKTDVVYLQIDNRIAGMIERINNADKQQRKREKSGT